jgi:hypothetical protein
MYARTRLPVSRLRMPGGGRLPVRMSAQSSSINFAWDASVSEGVTGYKVYWGTAQGSYANPVDVGNVLAYSINHPGVQRHYAVTAYNATHESEFSNDLAR